MKIKSKKQLAEILRRRETERQFQQYLAELEHLGPNGVSAIANGGVVVSHWDGSQERMN